MEWVLNVFTWHGRGAIWPVLTMKDTACIPATRLRLRSWLYFLPFVWHARLARRQGERAPGFITGKVIRDAKQTYWTITAWVDQAAMEHYRNTDAHRRVMPQLAVWCDEAAVVHWSAASDDLPTVQEAHRRIVSQGRLSKVRLPSLAHEVKRVEQPVVKGELQFNPVVKTLNHKKGYPPNPLGFPWGHRGEREG